MGKTRGPYQAEFPPGSKIRIKDSAFLQAFFSDYKLHHRLHADQLPCAGREARVAKVSFYHGGDELYALHDVPGTWHEQCLELVEAAEPGPPAPRGPMDKLKLAEIERIREELVRRGVLLPRPGPSGKK